MRQSNKFTETGIQANRHTKTVRLANGHTKRLHKFVKADFI